MTAEMVPCPHCGEAVRLTAKRCRHCSKALADPVPIPWHHETAHVPRASRVLPDHACLMCAAEAPLDTRLKDYSWVPAWVYLGFVLFVVPGFALALFLRQDALFKLTLCHRCWGRWTAGTVLTSLFAGLGLLILPVAGALVGGAIAGGGAAAAIGALIGLGLWLVGLVLLTLVWLGHRSIRCVRIDPHAVHLKFPDPDPPQRVFEAWLARGPIATDDGAPTPPSDADPSVTASRTRS